MILPELLAEPVRARIYIEAILNKEVTAEFLMEKTKVSRSTLSHHLTRFVESKVLNVRVGSEKYHRLVKYYSINPDFSGEISVDSVQDTKGKKRIMFLQSAAAHLYVISSLILENAKKPKKTKESVTFTFSFLSNEEADIWLDEYDRFQKRVERRCKKIEGHESSAPTYIAFGGLTPTR